MANFGTVAGTDPRIRFLHPQAKKKSCAKGHPYYGENLITGKARRGCRKCHRVANAKYRAKQREKKTEEGYGLNG